MMDLINEQRNLNRIAGDYDISPFDRLMRHFMMRSLTPFLVKGRALEVGCFQGEFTSLLAEKYSDLTVVEVADAFLEVTRRRVRPDVKFVNSLFEEFETPERFDAIFFLHILEHLADPVGMIRRAKSFLAPGGRIYLVVPNANAASRRIAVKMGVLPGLVGLSESDLKHGHRRVYSFDTLAQDAKAAGLRIVQEGGILFKPLANFQFDKLLGGELITPAFMEGCYELGQEFPDLCASIFLVGE